jgi:NADH dehydrogenase [ubiquinone] 1 alpha subcomplex assembly factor 3
MMRIIGSYRCLHHPLLESFTMLRTSVARLAQPLSARGLHTTRPLQSLQNIFETSDRPSLTIAKLTPKGFHLSDDLVVPGGLVLAGYQALLWNVDPPKGDGSGGMEEAWKGWTKERFQVFESVVPRPGQSAHACVAC